MVILGKFEFKRNSPTNNKINSVIYAHFLWNAKAVVYAMKVKWDQNNTDFL